MQFKMAGSPRLLQRFYRLYFGIWIPGLAWASTWWPLGLMYWMARWLVLVPFGIVRPKYLRAIRSNYARILGLPENSRTVRRISWQMMFEHAYHWIDFFRWSQVSAEMVAEAMHVVEGEETFHALRASKRGTLMLTAHMGNVEVGGIAMGKRFEPVSVLYWRDRFEIAEEFRAHMRERGNVHGIPVDATPLSVVPALRVLREGGLLAAHGDRDFNNQGWPVEFCGAAAMFPPGPFLLAARTGAVVVPTFVLLERNRHFRVIYEPPIDMAGNDDVEARTRAGLEKWVLCLERRIREYPEQWYCFYPFWETGVNKGQMI